MNKAALVLIIILGAVLSAAAQQDAEDRFEIKKETYIYRSEGSRDPFLSLIIAIEQVEEKKKKGLVPIEDYDLSQMTLTAVVWDKEGYYALVGLPSGKYYTVREGMSIGIHDGKVRRITDSSVVVREYIRDYKGRLQEKDRYLKLRKKEER